MRVVRAVLPGLGVLRSLQERAGDNEGNSEHIAMPLNDAFVLAPTPSAEWPP